MCYLMSFHGFNNLYDLAKILEHYQHLKVLSASSHLLGRKLSLYKVLASGNDLGSMKFMLITSYILNVHFNNFIH